MNDAPRQNRIRPLPGRGMKQPMPIRPPGLAKMPIQSGGLPPPMRTPLGQPGQGSTGVMPKFKKGGVVKKTGPAVVHKGERVLTANQAKKMPLAKLERKLTKK